MMRIETTAAFATNLSQIVQESRGRQGSKHILCADPTIRGHIASALSDAERSPLGAGVLTTVLPSSVDQIERVVLNVGRALGADVLAEASAQLTQGDGGLDRALNQLSDALRAQSRALVMVQTTPPDQTDAVHNSDIWRALGGRRRRLYRWFEEHGAWCIEPFNYSTTRSSASRLWSLRQAPLRLSGGSPLTDEAWARLGEDATALNRHLLSELIQGQSGGALLDPDEPLELLGAQLIYALELLAANDGPLSGAFVRRLTSLTPQELDEGLCLNLWIPLGDQLIANPSWAARALARCSTSHRDSLHRSLGEAFAREVHPNDPNAFRLGLSLLEAHRHLLRAGEWSRAVEYARFGTALLIDRAQSISREARSVDEFGRSARLYEQVTELHDRQPGSVPAQLRAYALHYLHFNRARAQVEPMSETRRGYEQATELWPEHALFWSRLVRALIYEGRHADAHTALQDAKRRVPEHPNKLPTLIGRTVGRLLQRGLLLDAAEIWGDYAPTMVDRPVQRQLQDRLQAGWTTDQLSLVGGPMLTFTRPARLVVQLIQDGLWQATVEGDVLRARGPSPVAALRALIERARARCGALLLAFTHTLDARARLEKQVLLGLVDVVRSGLDAPPPQVISVLGNLRRLDGALALHTVGSRHDVFPLSDAQAQEHVASEQLWIAELRGGPGGLPEGPVLRLTPAYEANEEASLLSTWERRLANAD